MAVWIGFFAGVAVLAFAVIKVGGGSVFLNLHGPLIVFGGTLSATLVNTPINTFRDGFVEFWRVFFPRPLPSPEDAIREIVRLSDIARAGGGLLALRGEGGAFADGFLGEALDVAISTGETAETRKILGDSIRQRRMRLNESSNLFRTMGVLAPMFGLLGTLLGIIGVLRHISEPTMVGPSMAVAISTAFYGIAAANFICVPMAGRMRSRGIAETQVQHIISEGVLGLMDNKPTYVLELHLRAHVPGYRPGAAPGAQP